MPALPDPIAAPSAGLALPGNAFRSSMIVAVSVFVAEVAVIVGLVMAAGS